MPQLRVQDSGAAPWRQFVASAFARAPRPAPRMNIVVDGTAAEQAAAARAIRKLATAPSARAALQQLATDGVHVRFVTSDEASAVHLGAGAAAMYDSATATVYVRMSLKDGAGALIHEATHHLAATQGRDATALLHGRPIEQVLQDPTMRAKLWAARVSDEAGAYRQQAIVLTELGEGVIAPGYALRADGTVASELETYRAFDREARQDGAGLFVSDYDRIQGTDTFSAAERSRFH